MKKSIALKSLFFATSFVFFYSTLSIVYSQTCISREMTLHPGKYTPDPSAGTNTCSCGIVIQTDKRTCDNEATVEPNHYLCDGPESNTIDCLYGPDLVITKNRYECQQILVFRVDIHIFRVRAGIGVCSGTTCAVVGSVPVSAVPNAYETVCAPGQQ